MKYPLEDLLRVRQFREDSAAAEVTARRSALERAEEALEDARRELAEYADWRVKREEEMYQELMQKTVQKSAFDDLKLNIDRLRTREVSLEENCFEKEKAIEAATVALDEAQASYQLTVRDRQKIDEHKDHWAQEMAREVEYNQEKELEDFRVREPEADEPPDDEVTHE